MNKKAALLTSFLLVSMPIYAKGFLKDRLMKSKHQTFVENSNNPHDFSGLWVGTCDKPLEKLALKITQTDKNIILADAESTNKNEESLKFPINQVKSKIVSTLHGAEHSLSSALWVGQGRIDLSFYSIERVTEDHTIYSFVTNYEVRLDLENDKLKFIIDNYPDNIVCILDKQD
ncbi:hypothetical protein [Legionella sp. W05-934-2]|jgi:hypothetical protein|uniref:hypothetical protein n=1 Tax=Legionella sp. W05-934-2 TaxID=1198649 RepID=UPI00346276E4